MISEPSWDWYSPTLSVGPDEVLGELSSLGEPRPCRALYSYERGMEFFRPDGESVCRAFWGGVNGERSVHVQCSGSLTGQVVRLIRATWPEHRVARADACADWCEVGVWRPLLKAVLRVRKEFGLASGLDGDWITRQGGRTIYLGSPKSYVRARLYEKGKQLGADPGWVRLEAQVRPSGEGKANLASVEPGALFAVTPWARALADRVGIPELEAVRIRDPKQPSDDDRAFEYMLRQYGKLLRRKRDSVGSWSDLGKCLGSRLGGDGR